MFVSFSSDAKLKLLCDKIESLTEVICKIDRRIEKLDTRSKNTHSMLEDFIRQHKVHQTEMSLPLPPPANTIEELTTIEGQPQLVS